MSCTSGFQLPTARYSRLGKARSKKDDEDSTCLDEDEENEKEDGFAEIVVASADNVFTVEEALEHVGFGRYQIFLSVFCGMLLMSDAMEMVVLSFIGPEVKCVFGLTAWQETMLTTAVALGMTSGWLWGWFLDSYGRKRGLFVQALVVTYFSLVSSLALSYGWLVFLRFMVGVGVGGTPNTFVFYSEFMPTKARAHGVNFVNVWWSIGATFEVGLAYFVMPSLGWRYLLAFSALPFIIVLGLFPLVYPSPRFHVLRGDTERAQEILKHVARVNGRCLPPGRLVSDREKDALVKEGRFTQTQQETIQTTADQQDALSMARTQKARRANFKDLFRTRLMQKATFTAMALWFSMAFIYFGAVLLTTEIQDLYHGFNDGEGNRTSSCIDHVGDSMKSGHCHRLTTSDYRRTVLVTVGEFPGIALAFIFCIYLSRKKSLAICFGCVAVFFSGTFLCHFSENFIIGMLSGVRIFATTAYMVMFVYTPELYPTSIRAIGMGACTSAARLGSILTPFVAQWLVRETLVGTKMIYVFVALSATVVSLLLPLETKGRPMLETVEGLF